ncbi:MAG: T9SS type A sorting domain-containing protein, partial [Bacteroidota bacterium]
FTAGDGQADMIPEGAITVANSQGENFQWIVTDDQNNILGLPPVFSDVDFDEARAGTCLVWYLRYDGDITGLEMNGNLDNLVGCFGLSNAVTVTRTAGDTGGFQFKEVIINEVSADGQIELFNGTDEAINVSDYWLCNFPAYTRIGTMTVECGELLIQPGEVTVISGFGGFDAVDAELGLYTTNSFGSSNAIISYLEWGSTGHQRSNVAVAAGVWETGQVVDAPTTSQSQQVMVDDNDELVWALGDPSLCELNTLTNSNDNPSGLAEVTVFPNPVNDDFLNVEVSGMAGPESMVEVFDLNGRRLLNVRLKAPNGRSRVQLPDAPAGAYVLRVINDGRVATSRFTRY